MKVYHQSQDKLILRANRTIIRWGALAFALFACYLLYCANRQIVIHCANKQPALSEGCQIEISLWGQPLYQYPVDTIYKALVKRQKQRLFDEPDHRLLLKTNHGAIIISNFLGAYRPKRKARSGINHYLQHSSNDRYLIDNYYQFHHKFFSATLLLFSLLIVVGVQRKKLVFNLHQGTVTYTASNCYRRIRRQYPVEDVLGVLIETHKNSQDTKLYRLTIKLKHNQFLPLDAGYDSAYDAKQDTKLQIEKFLGINSSDTVEIHSQPRQFYKCLFTVIFLSLLAYLLYLLKIFFI